VPLDGSAQQEAEQLLVLLKQSPEYKEQHVCMQQKATVLYMINYGQQPQQSKCVQYQARYHEVYDQLPSVLRFMHKM
jgi:hypothetical protein